MICIIQPLREMRGKGGLLEILTYQGDRMFSYAFLFCTFLTKQNNIKQTTAPSQAYGMNISKISLPYSFFFSTSINDGRNGKLHYNSILLSLSILFTIFTIVDDRFMKKKMFTYTVL